MMEITDNTMEITREDGVVDTYKILFYFHNEERGKDFSFLYREDDEDNLIVMASSDGVSLMDVDEEELEECQEMLDAYEDGSLTQNS